MTAVQAVTGLVAHLNSFSKLRICLIPFEPIDGGHCQWLVVDGWWLVAGVLTLQGRVAWRVIITHDLLISKTGNLYL